MTIAPVVVAAIEEEKESGSFTDKMLLIDFVANFILLLCVCVSGTVGDSEMRSADSPTSSSSNSSNSNNNGSSPRKSDSLELCVCLFLVCRLSAAGLWHSKEAQTHGTSSGG